MVQLNPKLLKPQSPRIDKFYDMVWKNKELVLYGPTECAKTFEAFKLAHALCSVIPNLQVVALRKAQTTIYSTVLQTLRQHILPYGLKDVPENPIKAFGGENKPQWLDYKETGSRMWFLGEDDKTGKALGTEWDLAVYSQSEQATQSFWEELAGRCTGRAGNWRVNGRPHGCLIGECNPASSRHFLRNRWKDNRCDMLKFTHEDNIMMYRDGDWTQYGRETRDGLRKRYTGTRFIRLFDGDWVGVEGAVYPEYQPEIHDVDEDYIHGLIRDDWIWSASVDYGYNHPFVFQLWVGDSDRSRLFLYKEIYKTELDPEEMNAMVMDLLETYVPDEQYLQWIVTDHRPELNKGLAKLKLPVENAEKEVIPGIAKFKEYLNMKKVFFNKNSLVHVPDLNQADRGFPTRTVHEFEMYAFKPLDKQNGSLQDEKPIPIHDDGCDGGRYEIVKWDTPTYRPLGLITSTKPKEDQGFL